jgi:autotransporter-associated beta strand protein
MEIGLASNITAHLVTFDAATTLDNFDERSSTRYTYANTLYLWSGLQVLADTTINTKVEIYRANNNWMVADGKILTVRGVISDSSTTAGQFSLTKSGPGLLILTGANTFDGGLYIDAGVLQIGEGSTAGSIRTQNVTIAAGARLDIDKTNAVSLGAVFGDGQVMSYGPSTLTVASLAVADYSNVSFTIYGTGMTVSQAADSVYEFSGVIDGTGSFTKAGARALTMSGIQAYQGGTFITGGTLNLVSAGRLPDQGDLTMTSGALNFASDQAVGLVSLSGNVSINGGTLMNTGTTITGGSAAGGAYTATINATLDGGGLTIQNNTTVGSTITVNLNRPNYYVGDTVFKSGTLQLGDADALVSSLLIKTGGTLKFNVPGSGSGRDAYNVGGLSGTSGFSLVTADNTTAVSLVVYQDIDTTFSGVISGTTGAGGEVLKYGDGELTLSGNNTFNGLLGIVGGGIKLGAGGGAGSVAVPYVYGWDDTWLAFDRSTDLTFNAEINKGAWYTINGPSVHKYGAARLTLNGNSNFTGGFNLWNGIVGVGSPGALGGSTGAINLWAGTITSSSATGHVLTAAGASALAGNIAFGDGTNKGSLTFNNAFDLYGSVRTLTVATGTTASLLGALTNGGLVKAGVGTLTLGGNNAYAGSTTLSAGTLRLANSNAAKNSTLAMAGGALIFEASAGSTVFNFGGLSSASSGTGYNITLNNSAGAGVALSVGANNESTVYRGLLSGLGSLTKTGAGTLTLSSSSNTFSGGINILAGTLQLGESIWDPISLSYTVGYNINVANGARLVVKHGGSQTYGQYSYALISGAGSVTVDGGNYAQGWYTTRQQYTGVTFDVKSATGDG